MQGIIALLYLQNEYMLARVLGSYLLNNSIFLSVCFAAG